MLALSDSVIVQSLCVCVCVLMWARAPQTITILKQLPSHSAHRARPLFLSPIHTLLSGVWCCSCHRLKAFLPSRPLSPLNVFVRLNAPSPGTASRVLTRIYLRCVIKSSLADEHTLPLLQQAKWMPQEVDLTEQHPTTQRILSKHCNECHTVRWMCYDYYYFLPGL